MSRPSQARLNLSALHNNLAVAKNLAPGCRVIAVVKADAYGHGALVVARALEAGVDALAVACIEEAVALRDGGVSAPVVLLQGVFEASELKLASELNCWVIVNTEEQICWLEEAQLARALNCWLKVDTGMHRLGITPDIARASFQRLQDCPQVSRGIVMATHFASADDVHSDLTRRQIDEFERACAGLACERSAANSAGVIAWPSAHYDWIRPGYMLYGNSPMATEHPGANGLQPVMTLVSAVSALRQVAPGETVGYGATWTARRPSRIATVTIGYGDGYPRLAATGTPVLVNGQRATLAGRVSMDMITVDVTELPEASIGDEVVLWGEGLPIGEVAAHAGTIGYELTTRMPARTPRVVVDH